MSFPRYPKYKDSGVKWLGQIPAHWKVTRLKRECWITPSSVDKKSIEGETAVLLCNYTDVYYNDAIRPGIEFMSATASADEIARFTLRAGDTIITKDSETADDIAVSAYVPHDLPGVLCGYHLSIVRARRDNVGAFIKRVFESAYAKAVFEVRANGLTRVALGQYDLDNAELPFPPAVEQATIVTFLDRETAKIDALVAEQQRLIELLKEKRQTVISDAVTRGLSSNAPTNPSGVRWLGEVPAHWSIASVRRVVKWIEQGWSPECVNRPAELGEWGVVKAGCVNRGVFVDTENKALPESLEPVPQYEVHAGDVLMSRASGSPELVGSAAHVVTTRPKLMLSDKIFRLHPMPHIAPEFLALVFNSRALRSQIERSISGADGLANNLPQSTLKGLVLALPPLAEQQAIVSNVSAVVVQLDALAAEGQQAIDLLQERRAALISVAVTGQVDVRSLVHEATA